jgi:hypothetical protein
MTNTKIQSGAATPVYIVNVDSTIEMENRSIEGGASTPVYVTNFDEDGAYDQTREAMNNSINAIESLVKNTSLTSPTITQTAALNGSVMEVSIRWTAHTVNIGGTWLSLGAGSVVLNTADVANPTAYYVYARNVGGAAIVVASATDPEHDPLVDYKYAWVSIARIKSVGGTETVYYVRRAYTGLDTMLHHAGEWDLFKVPVWLDGGALTITAATGVTDMAKMDYRRLRFEGHLDAIVGGALLLDNETSVANLELITTYSDGSTITGGTYHKVLLGAITSLSADYPFMVIRQALPAVEYATLDAALSDAENKAATAFPLGYRGNVVPIAYVIMLKGDASDLTTVDLRSSGITGSGGGGTPIADHSLLSNLGADDHAQYLRTDGGHTLTGNMAVSAGITVDGVDIGAHTHSGAGVNGVQIPSTSVSDFTEAAQDSVGAMLLATNDITLTYVDATPSLSALFTTTGELVVNLVNGANNNVNIGTALLIYIQGPTASFSITGLTGGYAGRVVYLYSTVVEDLTLTNESANSTAANRIRTLGSTSATSGVGCITLVYSAQVSRWIVTGLHS